MLKNIDRSNYACALRDARPFSLKRDKIRRRYRRCSAMFVAQPFGFRDIPRVPRADLSFSLSFPLIQLSPCRSCTARHCYPSRHFRHRFFVLNVILRSATSNLAADCRISVVACKLFLSLPPTPPLFHPSMLSVSAEKCKSVKPHDGHR